MLEDKKDVLEYLTDWLMANVVDDELFIEYCNSKAVTTISDHEVAKSILKDRGCSLISDDNRVKDLEELILHMPAEERDCFLDSAITDHFSDRDIEELVENRELSVCTDIDDAIDFIENKSFEKYIVISTTGDVAEDVYSLIRKIY